MLDKDQQYIWHPYTPLEGAAENILIESGKGEYLYSKDGRRIIDAISSWWVNLHGHAHEHLAEAIAEQVKKLEQVIFAGFTHEQAIRLAERLIGIIPGSPKKIFFSDNGSTAVEVGLKMALQYWYNQGIERRKIIALEGAFHGDTFGAMAVGERSVFTKPFNPLLFEVLFIDFPSAENERKVIEQFTSYVQGNDVAAFIYEPLVQGAGGMRMYSPAMLEKLLKIAKDHKVVCIADEVMTGFGRTGKMFASMHCTSTPDIVCISKGVTGGFLPLGITSCTGHIAAPFTTSELSKTFFHGHSFTANPVCCAAANASLDLLEKEECWTAIARIEKRNLAFKEELQSEFSCFERIDCLGVILSFELKTNTESGYFNDLRNILYKAFLERNVLLRPLGNVLYILPPYCISDEALNEVYSSVKEVLRKLF